MTAHEESGRVLLVSATFFGGLALAALATGLIAQLTAAEAATLVAFVVIFAIGTYALDRDLRGYLRALFRKAPGGSPAASPAVPSSAHTSPRDWDATRGQAGD